MSNTPFEVYEEPVPKEVSVLPPLGGYVTFVGTNSTDRLVCMREAFTNHVGSYDVGSQLGTSLKDYNLLLQIFRIDDTETTLTDFAYTFRRILRASKTGTGPKMLDGWVVALDNAPLDGHRTSYGFILFEKPKYTLAEYSEDLYGKEGDEGLKKAVMVAAPLVRDLVVRISDHGECWPGPLLDPHGVGLYFNPETNTIEYAVVIDWSACMVGQAPVSRIIPPLLDSYKKFLDNVEKKDKGIERDQDLFFEAMKKLV